MNDIDNALNMEYIRNVHSDGVTELENNVTAHKNSSDSIWNNRESAHSTRYSNLDSKAVNVDG